MAKNIVLLSDGTGNSSAQLMKTNVWRVYEALQLTDPTLQVACYDDGVGTSSFRPLAVAGGAFGVGLRRNVLRLYRFLCEHYDPGDRIYLFGFSRGAFTVRVLAGLICDQGIIRTRPTLQVPGATDMALAGLPASVHKTAAGGTAVVDESVSFEGVAFGSELARLCSWAYRDFRRHFHQAGLPVKGARFVRNQAIRAAERLRGKTSYDKSRNHQVESIDFIGVWDTVDAYGLPMDELTAGVDRWVWPLSMPDLTLNEKVKRACHVLALDDERNTFHPVMWDESGEPREKLHAHHLRGERISQVWFAGMHSNVGGGYPDDALSYVSLKWMTDQASDRSRGLELIFVPELLEHHTKKADPFGRLYDSRQGLKAYYRYNPRRIEWLTNGQKHEHGLAKPAVTIPRPKIHESVFRRIAAAPEAYAPIVLPERYAVVMEDGRIVDGKDNPYETAAATARRARAQEKAWDLVWQRRLVYFLSLFVTVYLVAVMPLTGPEPAGTPDRSNLIVRALDYGRSFLPGMASPWITAWQAQPTQFFTGLVVLLLLRKRGQSLRARICGTMRGIWLKVVPPAREEWKTLSQARSALAAVRSHAVYQLAFALFRRKVTPNVFGLAILLCLLGAVNRAPFEIAQATGLGGCTGSAAPLAPAAGQTVTLQSVNFCTPTGISLERGSQYQIEFPNGLPSNWSDGDVAVTSPAGISPGASHLSLAQKGIFTAFMPFRRLWREDWFVPIARIGHRGADHYPLTGSSTVFTAQTSGELFLFVNDAVLPLNVRPFAAGWDAYYANNTGAADVKVTRIAR